MIASRFAVSVLVVLGLLSGCDDKKASQGSGTPAAPATSSSAAANGAKPADAAVSGGVGNGSIGGTVVFEGAPPVQKAIDMKAVPQCAALHANPVLDENVVVDPKGGLRDVVVYVKDGAKLGGALPNTPVILDQVGCVYVPHVVSVMAGQELQAKNSDGFLHNVHSLSKENPEVNFPQLQKGQINKIATAAPETFKVKCDVHPWMNAWVVVLDHPFSAVTAADGSFTIKGLKDGKYTLVAWHPKLKQQEAEVEMKDGKARAAFKFPVAK